MHVDVALQVSLGDQRRQSVAFGGVQFSTVFTKLRRDVVQLEFGIDLFFGLSRDRFLCVELRQAVFAQRVAHLQGALA